MNSHRIILLIFLPSHFLLFSSEPIVIPAKPASPETPEGFVHINHPNKIHKSSSIIDFEHVSDNDCSYPGSSPSTPQPSSPSQHLQVSSLPQSLPQVIKQSIQKMKAEDEGAAQNTQQVIEAHQSLQPVLPQRDMPEQISINITSLESSSGSDDDPSGKKRVKAHGCCITFKSLFTCFPCLAKSSRK